MNGTLPADYHMHTWLCRHATGTAAELAAQACLLGIGEIGFSEHAPMPRADWDDWHMAPEQMDNYLQQIDEARRQFPQLVISVGLEVDYLPGQEDWVRSLAAKHRWDYLIGAVHYVSDEWAMDNPAQVGHWQTHGVWATWMTYFERLTMAAESGLFDIIAHPDLCKKFGMRPEEDCSGLFEGFLRAAQARGAAIELNTAGLRKPCREIYPGVDFLRMARRFETPITFGSDAHAPGEVGADFPQAVALARQCGYREYCTYRGRARSSHPL